MIHFSITVRDDVAQVTFDMQGEKVNKFNRSIFKELSDVIHQIETNPAINWVIFESQKPGIFIAGADIKELQQTKSLDQATQIIDNGHRIFDRWSMLSPKTIALIDGVALGGGLEFALACDFIVVTDSEKVKLGLPEVNLGIIPGWGGTQRLPRRIGLINGIQCIASGRTLSAKKALKIGCADAIVPSHTKTEALNLLVKNRKLTRRRHASSLLKKIPIYKWVVCRKARQTILSQTKGHYPAPLTAIDVIQKTYLKSLKKGCLIEKAAVVDLLNTPIPKHLMQLFFSQESIKKASFSGPSSGQPLTQIGIFGAGLMGGGIGWWFATNNHTVRFKDVSWKMIQKGYQAANKIIKKGIQHKKIPAFQGPMLMNRFSATLAYSGFKSMDFVIEAVPESMDLKKKVLADIESSVNETTIIATNTSALSVDELATCLNQPERFIGVHFFSPVQKMPLVEIIPSKQTSPDVISAVTAMVVKNKKFPIIVKNCPGFLINRLLLPYIGEAIHLVLQGFKVDDIDKIAMSFGMPIGPLALADEVGLDVGYHVLKILQDGYGHRFQIPQVFEEMVLNEGLLGKKSGLGFYTYDETGPSINNQIYKKNSIVMKYRISDQDKHEISDRLILIMLNEAARCIHESVVASPKELDLAMIMGTGFPAFRGGLLAYADQRGLSEICHRLNHLTQTVDQRFKPSDYLLQKSKEPSFFYREV